MDLKEMTSRFWNLYFHGQTQADVDEILSMLAPDIRLVGTGAHEVYQDRESFIPDLHKAIAEHDELSFFYRKFTCQEVPLTEDSRLLWGELNISGATRGSTSTVEMDTRYSMVFVQRDGRWFIRHIHHSVPFLEQNTGEYYPRSLYKQLEEVRTLADAMTELARKDSLTGLYNLRTLTELFEQNSQEGCWLVMGDLDNFKRINDVCGHMKGNDVLKQVAAILRANVRGRDAAARIGGDEFVLLCCHMDQKDMEHLLARILEKLSHMDFQVPFDIGMSMGAVLIRRGENMAEAMQRADQQMYAAKRMGKNRFLVEDLEKS